MSLVLGLQLHLPSYADVPIGRLLQFGEIAQSGGIQQLWVTDNLQSRNTFVVLAALASRVRIPLGTAVLVQYFRNPVDTADALAAVSELMDGRELSVGISRGNPSTPSLVKSPKPVTFLREYAESLQALLAGDTVHFADYPTLAMYFNLEPQRPYRLNFRPRSPIKLYCGGNAPKSLAVGGATMDGIVFGWTFLAAARCGRLGPLLTIAEDSARGAGRACPAPRIAEIKLYIDRDDAAARDACRRAVAGRLAGLFQRGYTAEDYAALHIPAEDMERFLSAARNGASAKDLADLVTDPMIDALFVAGDPSRCREQLKSVCELAEAHGFNQLMFSELGHDVGAALTLLCEEILR
jgi:alkanesulfonate monooxygenase SsuD/methylene tetrahydromethanopterin reductase-like flavin-dependent oxidoreductase (luciferase family)